MNTSDKIMALAEAYADAWGTNRTACRKELRTEIEALVRENEALREKAAMHDAMQEKQS